jgi:hypothetical protein
MHALPWFLCQTDGEQSRCMLSLVSVQTRDLTHGMLGKAGCFIHELLLAQDVTRVQLSLLCSLDFLHVYIINDVRDSLLAHAMVNYA